MLMGERFGDEETYLIMENYAMFGARIRALIEDVLDRNRNFDWVILIHGLLHREHADDVRAGHAPPEFGLEENRRRSH